MRKYFAVADFIFIFNSELVPLIIQYSEIEII